MQRLEAAFHRTRPQRRPGPHRPGDALEVLRPEVLQLEQIAEKSSRALGDDHHVRLGDPLQARREVRRLADDAALLRLSRSDQVADHNEPGCNADTGLQRSARLEPSYRRDQLQSRPYRPLGVVLMGLRIAEIHEHAVAHVFRHEAAEAAHGLGDAFLIGRNDLAQVLRVHAGGECRRTDQVREHHRDLAALGGVLGLRLQRGDGCRCCRSRARKLRNRTQHLPPMPERDTKLLEVLIGQVAKDGDINVVLGKALRVLGHAELFEPLRNLLHRGPVAYASGWAVRGVYPTRDEIEGHFPAGLTFLPRLLATADKVIE